MIWALILAWAIIAGSMLAVGWVYSILTKENDMPNDYSEPPCTCGHLRADHDDARFGGCRRCACGQYEPDYSIDIPHKDEGAHGVEFN